ncbi:hypothetical protein [Micavibrio aeruginosavorus]|uniref:Uncharacterized protein n=1 Tax=Micavibrio aeruginosavorus EPB TaxID=349215 RepID=M4VH56_9BACT|nr:hypothetical protein [Micavibrio aeruginosavorus]AGH98518.1 hypothetical protein A11S_1716 [Micavibrio aeruginosavorus EPB]
MKNFNTTLLREKFVIRDAFANKGKDLTGEKAPVVAMSNRMVIPLINRDGSVHEKFVIRAQNMHTCARMAAKIVQEFQDTGPILNRQVPFDWEFAWLSITKGYEKQFNPNRWIAVYNKGRVIYEAGDAERHPFLDIIEQCDARNQDNYEKAVSVAEDAFKQAGRLVTIEHDSNIALVITVENDGEIRNGVIVRGPNRTTTFNFIAREKRGTPAKVSQCLSAAAAFLEGIQLAFQAGFLRQKELYELISPSSEEAAKAREAGQKLGRLNGAIQQFEQLAEVSYRPERPDFSEMMDAAKDFAKTALADEIQRRVESGDIDKNEWVT